MTDTPAPAAEKKPIFENVELSSPIVRGEKSFDTLQLRCPKTGELRGLNVTELVGLDVVAITTLLPRISEPVLTPDEINDLAPADLVEIAGAIRGFFMTKGETAMLEAMMEQHQPKA